MNKKKSWTGERIETDVFNETSIEHLHRYAWTTELVKNKKVLDLACGEGYGSNLLASTAASVAGIDIDQSVIEAAKSKYKGSNLEFITGNVEQLVFADHEFDVIVSFETIEHISKPEKMMDEIKRILKPGGSLIISTPDKNNYTDKRGTKNPFHIKEFYEEEFRALLSRYFRNIHLFNQQIAFSSVITSKDSSGLINYSGDFNQINRDNGDTRLYCIAIASDEILPVLTNSLFNGASIFAEAVSEKEQLVKGTISYKLGHALLYPAKLIRKLFRK